MRQSSSDASRCCSERGGETRTRRAGCGRAEGIVVGQQKRRGLVLGAVALDGIEHALDLRLGQPEDHDRKDILGRAIRATARAAS